MMSRLAVILKWYVFYVTAKIRLPKMAAFLFFRALKQSYRRPNDKKLVRILILSGPSFKEDVMSSLGNNDHFEILGFDGIRKSFKAMAAAFLPAKINDMNYCDQDLKTEKNKQAYNDFLRLFWIKLQDFINLDAVLSGNFGYYAERELSAVLENLGTPFIVLHKENFKSPGRVEFFKEVYRKGRGSFGGRKILVYNEIERQVQIESEVATAEKVLVVGMPRLDRVHQWRINGASREKRENKTKRQVLIFSFGEKTGLPRGIPIALKMCLGKTSKEAVKLDWWKAGFEALGWWKLVRNYHMAVIDAARQTSEVKFIIKAKKTSQEIVALDNILADVKSMPKNLEIIKGGDALNYILESQIVCGFNTTGLIEAIAANKPVIVPWFDEAADIKMQPYIVNLEDTVKYARSRDELTNLLLRESTKSGLNNPPTELSAKRIKVVKKWSGNIDGKSGQRVRNAILSEIRQNG